MNKDQIAVMGPEQINEALAKAIFVRGQAESDMGRTYFIEKNVKFGEVWCEFNPTHNHSDCGLVIEYLVKNGHKVEVYHNNPAGEWFCGVIGDDEHLGRAKTFCLSICLAALSALD